MGSWDDKEKTDREYIIDDLFKDQWGTEWRVKHEYQSVDCHQDCGKEFWCRLTHISVKPDGGGYHNNYEKNREDFETVRTENLGDESKYVTEVQRDGKWILETNDKKVFGRLKEE